jgi:hypothetical protein
MHTSQFFCIFQSATAILSLGLLCLLCEIANASCGTAFCSIHTDWDTQTPWNEQEAAIRLNLRAEYIHLNQLRSGTDKIAASSLSGEHNEIETHNLNWIGNLSYAISPALSVALQMPVVTRDHTHIFNEVTGPEQENWQFTRLGDITALTHWRLDKAQSSHDFAYGLIGGVKLPTGSIKVQNSAGEIAERSLQPGSGSTDLIVGGFLSGRTGPANWYSQLRWQQAITERNDFQPGARRSLDLGTSYPLGRTQILAQLNMLWRAQDRGANAEPASSGGTFIFFSPGIAVPVSEKMQVNGFIQFPLLQDVRGKQLTADWAATLGLSMHF